MDSSARETFIEEQSCEDHLLPQLSDLELLLVGGGIGDVVLP